jgi:hypothetical protein
MKTTARDKVLSMPELLEAILLEVDLLTLLVAAQRVCQNWHALIHTSPSLQQALYFKPCTEVVTNYTQNNHLLARHFPNLLQQTSHLPQYALALDLARVPINKKEAFLRRGASWRNLLLHQPPMNVVRLASLLNDRHRSTRLYRHFALFGSQSKKNVGTDEEAVGKIGEGVHSLHDFAVLSHSENVKQHIFCCEWQGTQYIRHSAIFLDLCEADSVDAEVMALSQLAIFCYESESDSDHDYVYDH